MSIDEIAKKRIQETAFAQSITGRIIERIQNSDMYKINYLNEEIRALAMGGASYNQGDMVYILLPDKKVDGLKFILGRTNDRTPTITTSQTGELSPEILAEIQKVLELVSEISSDNIITSSEKSQLLIQWLEIQESYAEVTKQLEDFPSINTSAFTSSYEILKTELGKILRNLEDSSSYDGATLRTIFVNYFSAEQAMRTAILQGIKEARQYKVELTSSNGTMFINGDIDTEISAIVYRGTLDITNTLEPSAFIWKKADYFGNYDEEWARKQIGKGSTVNVDHTMMDGKITISCDIFME